MILQTFSAVTTDLTASLGITNMNTRVTVAGFTIWMVTLIVWMADACWNNRGVVGYPERDRV